MEMKKKGVKLEIISRVLINYAHNVDFEMDLMKVRDAIEAIVKLLPEQSRKREEAVPMAFLSSLLKSAVISSASSSCRSELEFRIGLQLDRAILGDILIPASSSETTVNPLYDTDSVHRIFTAFLNLDMDEEEDGEFIAKQSAIIKVSKLLDDFLAEVALNTNLTASDFITLAELLPEYSRIVSDGLYRAVDIFLKVHPEIDESDRYRICKIIDFEKLSHEAFTHAAQNEHLPLRIAVNLLYQEQIRMKNTMNGFDGNSQQGITKSAVISPPDKYAAVRRENRELKMEVARLRIRMSEVEKDHISMKQGLVRINSTNRFFSSLGKKIRDLFSHRRYVSC